MARRGISLRNREKVQQLPNRKSKTVIFITARSYPFRALFQHGTMAMLIYEDLVELARMCASNARMTTSREVADEL